MSVVIVSESQEDLTETAQRYGLPLVDSPNKAQGDLLVKTAQRWEFRAADSSFKPWFIDFNQPGLQQRMAQASVKTEALARACGLKTRDKLSILDATAGIGRDAYLLASLGCEVLMLERSPVLAILLQDALQQLGMPNLNVQFVDAIYYLQQHAIPTHDVIYLDPMFPEKSKSALVKKEMQLLQRIVGQDHDSEQLLALALTRAKCRVVVKRPINAAPLTKQIPHHKVSSKKYRFDIYLPLS